MVFYRVMVQVNKSLYGVRIQRRLSNLFFFYRTDRTTLLIVNISQERFSVMELEIFILWVFLFERTNQKISLWIEMLFL